MTDLRQPNPMEQVMKSNADLDTDSLIKSRVDEVYRLLTNAGIEVDTDIVVEEVLRLFRDGSEFDITREEVETVLHEYLIDEIERVTLEMNLFAREA